MARRRNRRTRQRENDANRNSNAVMRRYRQPRMTNENGITRVTGSELLYSTSVSSAGGLGGIRTNFLGSNSSTGGASLKGTWVANMAMNYNKYKFVRLTLRYVPFCTTSTQGRVVLAWNGDTNDIIPSSTQQVTQYQNAVEGPVWRELSCNALISRMPEYVVSNDGTGSTGDESGAPNQGIFLYAVDNGASSTATSCGSFYIDYELHLWSRAAFSANS